MARYISNRLGVFCIVMTLTGCLGIDSDVDVISSSDKPVAISGVFDGVLKRKQVYYFSKPRPDYTSVHDWDSGVKWAKASLAHLSGGSLFDDGLILYKSPAIDEKAAAKEASAIQELLDKGNDKIDAETRGMLLEVLKRDHTRDSAELRTHDIGNGWFIAQITNVIAGRLRIMDYSLKQRDVLLGRIKGSRIEIYDAAQCLEGDLPDKFGISTRSTSKDSKGRVVKSATPSAFTSFMLGCIDEGKLQVSEILVPFGMGQRDSAGPSKTGREAWERGDYQAALQAWRSAAEKGDSASQNSLGIMYAGGFGVAHDDTEAVAWYRKAATQGYVPAQYNLGIMYYNGQGVAQDYEQASNWYLKAVDQGYDDAQQGYADTLSKLASEYLERGNNSSTEKNYAQAAIWYRKAAQIGDPNAQYKLGGMYADGRGVKKDDGEAADWYRKAADQGNAYAQDDLGVFYANGSGGFPKDLPEAISWFRKAAVQGNANAQNNLGIMYGLIATPDYAESAKWYRKSAEQGYAAAQDNLGGLYFRGQGVKQDYAEAIKWFTKAADQGNADASYRLGIMYANGSGVEKDETQAMTLFRKAAAQGSQDARRFLAEVAAQNKKEAEQKAEVDNCIKENGPLGCLFIKAIQAEMESLKWKLEHPEEIVAEAARKAQWDRDHPEEAARRKRQEENDDSFRRQQYNNDRRNFGCESSSGFGLNVGCR